jgi:hypothetical protein
MSNATMMEIIPSPSGPEQGPVYLMPTSAGPILVPATGAILTYPDRTQVRVIRINFNNAQAFDDASLLRTQFLLGDPIFHFDALVVPVQEPTTKVLIVDGAAAGGQAPEGLGADLDAPNSYYLGWLDIQMLLDNRWWLTPSKEA